MIRRTNLTEADPKRPPVAWLASIELSSDIVESGKERGIGVTWLNHSSILRADWDSLKRIDRIGIDGTLLQLLLRSHGIRVRRTSADMCIPQVLKSVPHARIALIGGSPGVAKRAGLRLNNVVCVSDGYEELENILNFPNVLTVSPPDIIVLGLGAGLQDRVLVQLRALVPAAIVITAGGWLDQLAGSEQYFPPWVHAIRLGWLLRLLREPRRLIRRYTIEAYQATQKSPLLVSRLQSISTDEYKELGIRGHGADFEAQG